ncbi:hypothetical protein I3843_16G066600 [Carya illinoinensis]|nr:hypothetical protein I3843_16G066600 [Carya illinoinensis]
MAVGELFLSAFLQVLFDRLASPELLKFARQEGLRKQLHEWGKTLAVIRKVLDDAEDKQYTEEIVKRWLDDLRNLAYDLEDILDEFTTEALRRQLLMGESQAATTSKVRNLVPSCCTGLTPSAVNMKIKLRSKITEITARFNDLVTQKDQLNLQKSDSLRPNKRREIPPTTSVVTEDLIYGREEVTKAVVQLLVSEEHSGSLIKVNVIPIHGMGGIGKTALAQLVYNDKKVHSFFDLKGWACVSEDFDVTRVTKSVLQSLTLESENYDGKDLNWLQIKLKEKLLGKRFLVVLDDVWNENYNDWILLRTPFEAGAPGSSIVITTRNQAVSKLMGTIEIKPFHLELLSYEACLSIFSQHALDARDFNSHPNLKSIVEEIVKRCKGLPLAVKTVGGLLRSTQEHEEWENVLKSKIWDIPEERSGIAPALMLSYHNLPSHLKRCFAYCSILPKDYEFEEKEVVLLWMAEGLIQPLQEDKKLEDLGTEYFRNLWSRSFFQQSCINKSRFIMHDLINDLAQSVAGDTCFRIEDRSIGNGKQGNISIEARHSSYLGSRYDSTKKFEVFTKLTSLRTFLPFMLPNGWNCYLAHYVPFVLVPALRCLRVLSFKGYCIFQLSDSIGELKHLRYLDVSKTKIRRLPESISTLYNLQTLLLENCSCLKKLPSMFENLVNLRHLNIEGANSLEGMPLQIGKLTRLQTLSNFVLGKSNCSRVKELGPLVDLGGTLRISRLENEIEPKDAKDAKLIEKPKVRGLWLQWNNNVDEARDRTSELEILNGLQPHEGLKELVISYYGGKKFPIWLSRPSFSHMVSLTIKNCKKCTSLPSLGKLPKLKFLTIKGMASVKNVGQEFCGHGSTECFSSLMTLSFMNMKEWENWCPCEMFPVLRELSLSSCPKLLGKLPKSLPLLNRVQINDCGLLVVSVSSFPDQCKIVVDQSDGVLCGSNLVTFKSIISDSVHTISELTCRIEGFDVEGLETLGIERWEEVKHLWSNDVGSLPHLPFLRILCIGNCDKLASLVAEEGLQLGMPSTLETIWIGHCKALESLPKAMMYNNTCLAYIHIFECDSLTHFARGQLPPTLKRLEIWYCKNMRKLVEQEDDDTINACSTIPSLLEILTIDTCPSLESLISSGELLVALRELRIVNCPKLESVAKNFHQNSYLESIIISECENLKFLNGFDLLPSSNLRKLHIFSCEKILALPNGIYNLTSLQSLQIKNCPNILSFPVEGLPANLTILRISNLKITEALLDWGLNNLTFLNELEISDCQHLVSFSKMTLPHSLTDLTISNCSNLECLSFEGLRELASLKTLSISNCEKWASFPENGLPSSLLDLHISNCQKLRSFPNNGLPPSLLELHISNCQKLRSFPKNGLPPSLQKLRIHKCLLLEERCKKDQGGDWHRIADIPYVEINDKYIYDTETEE